MGLVRAQPPSLSSRDIPSQGSFGTGGWRNVGSGTARSVAAGTSGGGVQAMHGGGGFSVRGTNVAAGGVSSGLVGRASGISGLTGSEFHGGPGSLRIPGFPGCAEASNSTGNASNGASESGSGAGGGAYGFKPRSDRFTRLGRYGTSLGPSQAPTSMQHKVTPAHSYNLRSGAAHFGAAAMGYGGMSHVSSGGIGGSGVVIGTGTSGNSVLEPQLAGLGGTAGAKPPYGVIAGASSGGAQSFVGRRGSNATVGIGGGLGGAGTSGGFSGTVGFGRHKYG